MQDLIAEAREAGKPLRLHVETFNPAQRLYERLGFTRTGEAGLYYEMEYIPNPLPCTPIAPLGANLEGG